MRNLLILFAALLPSAVSASIIVTPPGLNPGDPYRLAFVTSATRAAQVDDISVYNQFVDGLAEVVPELTALNQDWKVLGSSSTVSARDNTSTNFTVDTGVPIYLLDGNKLADDYVDLWDRDVDVPLNVTETGTLLGGINAVFAGTEGNGTIHGGRHLGSARPQGGRTDITDGWIWITRYDQDDLHRFFAISGVLSAQSEIVPEPSTILVTALGLLGMGWLSWRRRKRT